MKRVLVVFVMLAACSVLLAESIKWKMTNNYPKPSSEFQVWTNSIPDDAIAHVPFVELFEYKRRIDILWTDYTNRMERAARMYEKRRAAAERRRAEQARREALRRMSRRRAK